MRLTTWSDYAEYHHEPGLDHLSRNTMFDQKTCVARLMSSDYSGEDRFYVAPTEDGAWFAWGDWHGAVEVGDAPGCATVVSETAQDATYTFAEGGAYFETRDRALAAIYRWLYRDLALEVG